MAKRIKTKTLQKVIIFTMSRFLETEAMDVNRSRRSARANDVPAVELPLIPMTQPIPPAPQVVEVAPVPVVVTIDPKSVAVQDLFRRMAVNKLNIPKDAHPELTNCVEGKNVDRWSFDVSRPELEGEDCIRRAFCFSPWP